MATPDDLKASSDYIRARRQGARQLQQPRLRRALRRRRGLFTGGAGQRGFLLDGRAVHGLAPTREGRLLHLVPRALESDDIAGIVADYKSAALLAVDAGFDGVELHCANGYLMEQFLCDSVNKRTDRYGGSLENRARILFEALEAVLSGVDSNKVGIRFYTIEKFNDYDLVYLHLVEPRGIQVPAPDAPEGGELPFFRKSYHGSLSRRRATIAPRPSRSPRANLLTVWLRE
ncbi:12-oxophytodienoate reductase 1 [Phytophthora pseudosyringae]|uniref:12-oxophytodienoate reductase 1 n=1 Tax=Phytophthora pseudosyringae TaxID=221518 RepID=A0A8T1V7R9_9STRA|nr:12-oxophytodienoate reductase 1 [Phytophthora pseudosyringae]